jgi:predicted O-linked N-acetylglucosamine transferase (SPINDLY family)
LSAILNNKLRTARALLQNGDATAAGALCAEILAKAPRNPEALALRGIVNIMAGAFADAANDLRQALTAMPRDGMTLENLGLALLNLGEFAEAEQILRRAAALPGAPPSVPMRLGLAMLRQGRAAEALVPLRQAVQKAPDQPHCRLALGEALSVIGDAENAKAEFNAALQVAPGHPDALYNLGVIALAAGDLVAARKHFDTVLARYPTHADAMVNLAVVCEQSLQTGDAAKLLERALAVAPGHPHAHSNLGNLRLQSGHFADARRHFEAALAVLPGLPNAMEGLGAVARGQGRYGEAVHLLGAVTRLESASAAAWAALADSLLQTGDLDAADHAADKAAALDDALVWAWSLRAQLRLLRGELATAVDILDEGFRKTDHTALLGMLAQHSRHICDWARWSAAWQMLKPRILRGDDAGTPFALLCEDLTANELGTYTRTWAERRFAGSVADPRKAAEARDAGQRVRIGYLSSDFQEHPAAYLVTELLELHDRTRFEIYAYSYGPRDNGAMRQRIIAAVDHFVDIAWEPDDQAVDRIRQDNIDILVDLKGYTVGDRLGIMARRPSPVQVTWLGYPGTTGAAFIDYLIADPFIVPTAAASSCSEKVARLPHCYQPVDRKRIVDEPRARSDYGLPEEGLVFCCFNQTFKITPDIFAAWMRILQAIPGSVLWLVDDNRWSTANLRAAATTGGIAAERLIFAPRLPLSQHLARYKVADLALDTFPYTSHTTASDALWCGCPLVALCGETFASRVSASILGAAQLPALIANSLTDYESKVIKLAGHRELLQDLARRVRGARELAPLFDTTAFTQALEALYLQMQQDKFPQQP